MKIKYFFGIVCLIILTGCTYNGKTDEGSKPRMSIVPLEEEKAVYREFLIDGSFSILLPGSWKELSKDEILQKVGPLQNQTNDLNDFFPHSLFEIPSADSDSSFPSSFSIERYAASGISIDFFEDEGNQFDWIINAENSFKKFAKSNDMQIEFSDDYGLYYCGERPFFFFQYAFTHQNGTEGKCFGAVTIHENIQYHFLWTVPLEETQNVQGNLGAILAGLKEQNRKS